MEKRVFVFLFDGYSDWEIAYLTPELKKNKDIDLVYFTTDNSTVLSMGGIDVLPYCSLQDIDASDIDMLILPGGTSWEKGENREINKLVREVSKQNKPIGAICAATTYLGELGLLDNVKHTSNDVNYLKAIVPSYKGEENYVNEFAVSDQKIITANGIASIEFAREVMRELGIYNETELENWFQLFKNGVWNG